MLNLKTIEELVFDASFIVYSEGLGAEARADMTIVSGPETKRTVEEPAAKSEPVEKESAETS